MCSHMKLLLIKFGLDTFKPGVFRRRARVAGYGLLATLYVWFRSVLVADRARANRVRARIEHERAVAERMRLSAERVAAAASLPTQASS